MAEILSPITTSIDYFLTTYFSKETGKFREDVRSNIGRFFFKMGLCNNQRGTLYQKSREEIVEIVKEKSQINPFYSSLFCKVMCPGGIDTIFPLILKGGKGSLGASSFDPIKNRTGVNRGVTCRVLYKDKAYEFIAGNGSMRNVKNEGDSFFAAIGLNDDPVGIDQRVKFSVVHKMDGRYVALYVFKFMTDSGIPATVATIHSRKGVVIGSGLYDGPVEEMNHFRVEFDFTRKERVPILNKDGTQFINSKNKPEFEFVEKLAFSKSFRFTDDFSSFIPSVIPRTRQVTGDDGSIITETLDEPLISKAEINSAFFISRKLSYLINVDEMMLINCEGTKDNMRPLFDKFISDHQERNSGLFPHPFSTVVYNFSNNLESLPSRYLSDPRIFLENSIPICQIFQSPSGKSFWNTAEILDGLEQIDVLFGAIDSNGEQVSQKIYNIVDYANKILLKKLQAENMYTDFPSNLFPGHVSEGVIIGAHLLDGTFAFMKVKDDLFADEEEQLMKLDAL